MKIIGIDYSINSPALCSWDAGTYTVVAFSHKKAIKAPVSFKQIGIEGSNFEFTIHPYPVWTNQQERFHKVAETLLAPVTPGSRVVFEGYAMGMSSSRGRIFDIAEGCQTVKSILYREHGIVHEEASPGTIKKFATGKGNASKIPMREAFIERYGFDPASVFGNAPLSNPAEDIIDAVFISEMARTWAT